MARTPEQNSGGAQPQGSREEPLGIREDWFRMLIDPDPAGPDSREIDNLIKKFAANAHPSAADPSLNRLVLCHYLDWAVRGMVLGIDVMEDPLIPMRTAEDGTKDVDRQMALIATATRGVARSWKRFHPESAAARKVLEKNINAPEETQLEFLREIWPTVLEVMRQAEKS